MKTEAFALKPLWIVTAALTQMSTLDDILFQATPQEFARQVLGGLQPEEIVGWFDSYSAANQYAIQELGKVKEAV